MKKKQKPFDNYHDREELIRYKDSIVKIWTRGEWSQEKLDQVAKNCVEREIELGREPQPSFFLDLRFVWY